MYLHISSALWVVWYVYWIISARNRIRDTRDSKAKRESAIGRLGYTALVVAGFGLVIWHPLHPDLQKRLGPSSAEWVGAGLAMETAGLALAIWARQTLGKNWTGRITTGGSQELVVRGPYRFVRHPIYSGLLFAVLGTAIVVGKPRAFLGFLLILAGVLVKLRREEAALREHFGSVYEKYARHVARLVPGLV
jgi:protein-S-isoprenylcysteine O-methyltransferase Ste14